MQKLTTRGCVIALGVVGVLAVVVAVGGCGGGTDDSDELPAGAAVRVGETVIGRKEIRSVMSATAPSRSALRFATEHFILIEWMKQEAERRGIVVPGVQGRGAQGMAVRVKFLINKLLGDQSERLPTDREVEGYYRRHPRLYRFREVRSMKLVATESRARAAIAKRALDDGQGWDAVIARYSTDQGAPTPPSGSTSALPEEMPVGLDEALFTARRGIFYGPVKAEKAWYVFELTTVVKEPGQSLDEVREVISAKLWARNTDRRRQALFERLQARYRPVTLCSARLLLPECRNGPANTRAVSLPGL